MTDLSDAIVRAMGNKGFRLAAGTFGSLYFVGANGKSAIVDLPLPDEQPDDIEAAANDLTAAACKRVLAGVVPDKHTILDL